MTPQLKGRVFGTVFFFLMAACIVFNWYLLINEGYFYTKVSGLCPVVAMFGLMLLVFPSMAHSRPNRADKRSIVIPLVAGMIGLALGGVNFYLMDSYRP